MNTMNVLKTNRQVYEQFKFLYQQDHLNTAQLAAIYANDVVFRDPVHHIKGLPDVVKYFSSLGKNLNTCRFEFVDEIVTANNAHISWNMRFSHQRIANGKEQCVRGMTFISYENNKIHYHEDCYDMGALLYEHLPVLGKITQWLKNRMAA